MGRHSRGAADGPPPPPPEPPARHPYAARSPEDTGTWDRSTYRVVDVGLPPDAPVTFPLGGSRPTQTAGPNRAPARNQPPEPPRDLNGSRAALRSVPEAETGLRPPAEPSRYGATRVDLAGMTELRYGATREPGAPRYGATRVDLADPRLTPDPTRALAESRTGTEPARGRTESRTGTEPGLAESRYGAQDRYRAPEPRSTERHGATRADLAESVGATALAPRPEPRTDPDEVTDTGARRARSTFHLAPETQDGTDEAHDYDDEPSLLLQWGIFVAQTLTGAVAGLGVWLAFYRLWSTYPFYAAPSVGAATIVMLVLARILRRRHGHDLDLMTAIVTIGVATVLTVLPAAFTLQSLA